MTTLDVHEKALIIEGLLRVKINGRAFASKTDFAKETRDVYQRDADQAEALANRLRLEWWGVTPEMIEEAGK